MNSIFYIEKSDGMTCTNVSLKRLGTLHGVFGADIDRIAGVVTVNHTDEISRNEIAEKLLELGYPEIENPEGNEVIDYNDPALWGDAL